MNRDGDAALAGAVVLSDTWRVGLAESWIERETRIRVVGEAGRKGLQIQKLPIAIAGFEGRISYPDGTSIRLGKEELQEKELFGLHGMSFRRQILVLPGLTADCLVEVHFAFRVTGSEAYPFIADLWLGIPGLPSREVRLEMGGALNLSVLLALDPLAKAETSRSPGRITTVLRDLPAQPPQPFLADNASVRNRLYLYGNQLWFSSSGGEASSQFWAKAGEMLRDELLADRTGRPGYLYERGVRKQVVIGRKGPRYDALLARIREGLPEGAQARAAEVWRRLRTEILPWMLTTGEERKNHRERGAPLPPVLSGDVEHAAEAGTALSGGWLVLAFNVLRDAGLSVEVVKGVSSSWGPFLPAMRTLGQFSNTFFLVREPGREPLVLDPSLRFGSPGDIGPDCQGTRCLVLDSNTWAPAGWELPWSTPERNRVVFEYGLAPDGDAWKVSLAAKPQGLAEAMVRQACLEAAPSSVPDRALGWLGAGGQHLDGFMVGEACAAPADLSKPFEVRAGGGWRAGKGRQLRVDPAPGLEPFLKLLAPLLEPRKDPFWFGPPRSRRVETRIQLPEGYRAVPRLPFSRENALGSVVWTLDPEPGGRAVRVVVEWVLKKGAAPAAASREVRKFLGWVQEAADRRVLLEKNP